MKNNTLLNAVMGVVVGDALGLPVQFSTREEMDDNPVTDMTGHGVFDMPKGAWSDDSSLTLASLESIHRGFNLEDMADNFVKWLFHNEFTPNCTAYDIGNSCMEAISDYRMNHDVYSCGTDGEYDNGNGSLMRIMPVCWYMANMENSGIVTLDEAVNNIHDASALTHSHMRSKIGCGLYFFIVREMLFGNPESIGEALAKGLSEGFAYYDSRACATDELVHYSRLRNPDEFGFLPREEIRGSGYVVHTLEASVWCLLNTENYKDALLMGVNLGEDTDTTGAVEGGLAGLWYGYEGIPEDWRNAIIRREWIESLCGLDI
ncbi:MAG: ADP-ribosylglycohydrolase family protein [Clostridia bacterium]|nr:ADP-ribosylglycohydrolase family protein [Clostridia bacterium]